MLNITEFKEKAFCLIFVFLLAPAGADKRQNGYTSVLPMGWEQIMGIGLVLKTMANIFPLSVL